MLSFLSGKCGSAGKERRSVRRARRRWQKESFDKKGAVAFRQNQIKNDRSIVKTVFLSFIYANLKKSRLKTCGFLRFY